MRTPVFGTADDLERRWHFFLDKALELNSRSNIPIQIMENSY